MITLAEIKRKTLGLIEELSPDNENMTEDPDLATKFNDVTNQILFALARIKKIPCYIEMEVNKGDFITFADIKAECGKDVYQLGTVGGVKYEFRGCGTVIKVLETGTLEIDFFVYPTRITDQTDGDYVFELSMDALEIMPYGIAADLLKSDISTEYGSIYATRYESMLQRLDPRNNVTSIYIEGGV